MVKLLALLLLGLYVVLQVGGNDRGQMRPALAAAVAKGEAAPVAAPIEEIEMASVETVAVVPGLRPLQETSTSARATERLLPEPAVVQPDRVDQPVLASLAPEVPVAGATRSVASNVFTLSTLPGQEFAPDEALVPAAPIQEAVGAPEIWVVTARSVNVRQAPTTDSVVLGKLSRGDETLVIADLGNGWAEVRVEGDGIAGYVSMEFLEPAAN